MNQQQIDDVHQVQFIEITTSGGFDIRVRLV